MLFQRSNYAIFESVVKGLITSKQFSYYFLPLAQKGEQKKIGASL